MCHIIYLTNKKDIKAGNDFCEIANSPTYNFVIIKGIKTKIIFLLVCSSMLMAILLALCLCSSLFEIFQRII